jgi:flagellar motor switch protein FliM
MAEMQETLVVGKGIRPDSTNRIKIYDFKRPDKFSKDQIRTLSILHETFSRLIATTLSAMCRTEVLVHVAMVDQVTYEEYVRDVPSPAVLPTVHMAPLKGPCLFQYSNEIAYEMVERIYGGRSKSYVPTRDISTIEMDLIEEAHGKILANFREAWSNVFDISPRLMRIETNKHFLQMVPPTEMIVYVLLECKIGNTESTFSIMYPYLTIEPIISKLSVISYTSPPGIKESDGTSVRIGDLESELVVAVDGPEILVNELINLKPGDYIPLPDIDEGTGYLLLNETPIELCSWETPESVTEGEFALPEKEGLQDTELSNTAKRDDSIEPVKLLAKEIVGALQTEYRALSSRLDAIAGRQDDLTDQIAFTENIDETHEVFQGKPFGYISAEDAESFVPLLGIEHPQTIALILSYLEPHTAAAILGELSGEQRIDISERVCALGSVSPEALNRLDENVRHLFDQLLKSEFSRPGGIGRLVEMLNVANRSVEKEIIESLEVSNPDLAENIKKRMFIFEDIVLLDVKAVSLVVAEAKPDDLAFALRGVSEQVLEHVLAGCNSAQKELVQKTITETGPVRLSDVERAQMRIVSVIRKLEDRGSIHIAGVGEEIV